MPEKDERHCDEFEAETDQMPGRWRAFIRSSSSARQSANECSSAQQPDPLGLRLDMRNTAPPRQAQHEKDAGQKADVTVEIVRPGRRRRQEGRSGEDACQTSADRHERKHRDNQLQKTPLCHLVS
jgi:hypothetical protein